MVQVEHPHKYVLSYMRFLNGSDELAQASWSVANDTFRTDVCTRYTPSTIACAAIYIGSRFAKVPLPEVPEEKAWWRLFDASLQEIREICTVMERLYSLGKPRKWNFEVNPHAPIEGWCVPVRTPGSPPKVSLVEQHEVIMVDEKNEKNEKNDSNKTEIIVEKSNNNNKCDNDSDDVNVKKDEVIKHEDEKRNRSRSRSRSRSSHSHHSYHSHHSRSNYNERRERRKLSNDDSDDKTRRYEPPVHRHEQRSDDDDKSSCKHKACPGYDDGYYKSSRGLRPLPGFPMYDEWKITHRNEEPSYLL